MALDPNPGLRSELKAALSRSDPQMMDLENFFRAVSESLRDLIDARLRRRRLINNVLNALDAAGAAMNALENDGYPEMDDVDLIGSSVTSPVMQAMLDSISSKIEANTATLQRQITS